jgi:polygalacturonase
VYAETPGDVLIAGLDAAHRTEVSLEDVVVKGIAPAQVHLAFDDFLVHGTGANFHLAGEGVEVRTVMKLSPEVRGDPCAGRFVPMQ